MRRSRLAKPSYFSSPAKLRSVRFVDLVALESCICLVDDSKKEEPACLSSDIAPGAQGLCCRVAERKKAVLRVDSSFKACAVSHAPNGTRNKATLTNAANTQTACSDLAWSIFVVFLRAGSLRDDRVQLYCHGRQGQRSELGEGTRDYQVVGSSRQKHHVRHCSAGGNGAVSLRTRTVNIIIIVKKPVNSRLDGMSVHGHCSVQSVRG